MIHLIRRPLFLLQKQAHDHSVQMLFFSSSSKTKTKTKNPISITEYLTNQHQFSPKTALKASSTVPYVKNPENSDSVISFLKESGFSKPHLEKLIDKCPKVLSIKLKTLHRKIKFFRDLEFSASDTADIVSECPSVLLRRTDDHFRKSTIALKALLGSDSAFCSAVRSSNWLLMTDLEKNLMPNVDFFKLRGTSPSLITAYLRRFTRLFLLNPGVVAEKARMVEEMGFEASSRRSLEAVRVMCSASAETWKRKWEFLKGLGFSEDEILEMFRRAPQVLGHSESHIKKSMGVLLGDVRVDVAFVAKNPILLAFDIDRRIKPRLRVLEILERNGLLAKKLPVTTIFILSREKFFDRYVFPYSDTLGGDYVRKLGALETLSS